MYTNNQPTQPHRGARHHSSLNLYCATRFAKREYFKKAWKSRTCSEWSEKHMNDKSTMSHRVSCNNAAARNCYYYCTCVRVLNCAIGSPWRNQNESTNGFYPVIIFDAPQFLGHILIKNASITVSSWGASQPVCNKPHCSRSRKTVAYWHIRSMPRDAINPLNIFISWCDRVVETCWCTGF